MKNFICINGCRNKFLVVTQCFCLIAPPNFLPFIPFEGRPYFSGKETYSPEVESSPAPSSADPGQGLGQPHSKQSSRGNSFEIENLLKTAGEVSNRRP